MSLYTLTPDALRGRVMGIYVFTFFGAMPLGSLMIGALAARIGEPAAIVWNSLVTLAFASAVCLFMPKLRRFE